MSSVKETKSAALNSMRIFHLAFHPTGVYYTQLLTGLSVLECNEMCISYLEKTTLPSAPSHCIIWLHGLGADGRDFENIAPLLQLPEDTSFLMIFPNAPERPVTINHGLLCRAWYDIANLDRNFKEDDPGILASESSICELIDNVIKRGIPAERIFLGGFSQGAAMALFTGLRYSRPLAGIIALSGYLPLTQTVMGNPSHKNLPILMCHGQHDSVVPHALGRIAFETLQRNLYSKISFETFLIDHEVSLDELRHIGDWIKDNATLNGVS